MNHEEITYACPFCVVDPNDEECEFEVFEGVEELVSDFTFVIRLYICCFVNYVWCCYYIRFTDTNTCQINVILLLIHRKVMWRRNTRDAHSYQQIP